MISPILAYIGAAFSIVGLAAALTRRLPAHRIASLYATGSALSAIACVLDNEPIWAVIAAAACAYWLHEWWNNGGGDGTRRRLRRLRRAFHPTRRTAPNAA